MARTADQPKSAGPHRFEPTDALLHQVMERASVGLAVLGADSRLNYLNGAIAGMLGYGVDELRDAAVADLIHPDCNANIPLLLGRMLRGEVETVRSECRLRHRDGEAVWALCSMSVLAAGPGGQPAQIILEAVNIDRQKRAEAALAYAESRWNFALEAAGQGVWDYDVRADDMFYSNQWRRMRGIPADEYVDPRQSEWLKRIHPDDVPRILATVQKQNQGEEGFETLEYRERHRDGHYIWILSRGRPVEWDAQGNSIRTIGTDTDITRLKTVEAEFAAEKERLRVTLESIGDGVISTDADRRIVFMNPVAERMTGQSSAQAIGRPLEQVFLTVDETTGAPSPNPVSRCMETGEVSYLEEDVVLIGADGDRCDIRSSAAPLRGGGGEVMGAVLVFQDVTTSRALQKQLAHSATHDALTGLPNRLAFERALATVAGEASRDRRQHALCFIDLDRFKPVNDGSGHAAGDALLKLVAEVIRRSCRRQDFAARIGGDEFALLLSDCTPVAAMRVAQKIVDGVAAIDFGWEDRRYRIGASVGITAIADSSHSPVELMSEADAACYVAKANGRGQVAIYTPSN